jgi:hypothetical protein
MWCFQDCVFRRVGDIQPVRTSGQEVAEVVSELHWDSSLAAGRELGCMNRTDENAHSTKRMNYLDACYCLMQFRMS